MNDTTYNINTRSASITGDFGVIGDNNELTKIDTQYIINETNNTYYNPDTGLMEAYLSLIYDYVSRTYQLTLEGGDTTTVTYGDNNVTIDTGDEVTNVYYVYEAPPAHQHEYTAEITRNPTCTDRGVMTYTCTAGDSTYTESLPALGHDWVLASEVLTEYDEETGEELVAGYKIYECTRCGEQYKVTDGSGAPPSGGDDTGLTIPDSSGLAALRDKLLQFYHDLPAMMGDFTAFLQEGFSFVPEDLMNLIVWSCGLALFAGVFRFFWR